MLFSRTITPRCEYCKHGNSLNKEKIACLKKGVMAPDGHCRKFRYDPLKRTPIRPAIPDFSQLKEEDFSL